MRRVASMPSMTGMRMSIRTTSGVSSLRARHGLGAVACLADDLDPGFCLEDHPEARAHERLVVGEEDADHRSLAYGRRARTAKPPSGWRPGFELAADDR